MGSVTLIFFSLVIIGSFFLGANAGARKGSVRSLLGRSLVPHIELSHLTMVWYPHRGEWKLGTLYDPVDPERNYFWVRPVTRKAPVRVAHRDLRRTREPLKEAAPKISIVELEDMMKTNNQVEGEK